MSVVRPPQYEDLTVTDHAQERWSERSNRPTLDPRVAWIEAVPIDYPSMKPPARFARLHEPTRLILLVEPNGTLRTCIPLEDRSQTEQQYIRSQVPVTDE